MAEGDSLQYSWMVPYNLRGLFDDMGGNQVVVERLNRHFTKLKSGGASEYASMGNEPEEEVPWEFDFAGAPWRTQEVVRRIEHLFGTTPDGLPGNDDAGAISSWAVWAMMGIFPEIPGVAGFVIGSPLFSSVTLTGGNGQVISITGYQAADANPYVQSLRVNGRPTSQLWLPMSAMAGKADTTLAFTLTNAPNLAWGQRDSDAPPSFRETSVR